MLTLKEDKSSTPIVELHSKKSRGLRPVGVVYYSHNSKAQGNVAPAAGVLALHKKQLKRIHKLSNADFDRICVMIDTEAEPDSGEPLRSEYWELHKVYERALRTEMYLGDQDDLYFERKESEIDGVVRSYCLVTREPAKPIGWCSCSCATSVQLNPSRDAQSYT